MSILLKTPNNSELVGFLIMAIFRNKIAGTKGTPFPVKMPGCIYFCIAGDLYTNVPQKQGKDATTKFWRQHETSLFRPNAHHPNFESHVLLFLVAYQGCFNYKAKYAA